MMIGNALVSAVARSRRQISMPEARQHPVEDDEIGGAFANRRSRPSPRAVSTS
jgi:hypothetical protein